MTFFERMAALADKFTNGEKFTPATLTRTAGAAVDPATGLVSASGITVLTCRAVIGVIRERGEDGVVRPSTMATLNVEPKIDDVLTLNGVGYRVTSVSETAPNGVAIIYHAAVKK